VGWKGSVAHRGQLSRSCDEEERGAIVERVSS